MVLRSGLVGGTRLIVLSILVVSPLTAPVTGMKRRALEVEVRLPAIPAAQPQEDR